MILGFLFFIQTFWSIGKRLALKSIGAKYIYFIIIIIYYNSAIICCIRGRNQGCIKLYSGLAFATEFMAAIRNIYDATRLLPQREKNKSRETDPTFKSTFIPGNHKLISIMARRKAYTRMDWMVQMDLSTPRNWKVLHRGGLIKELPISNEWPWNW